MIEHLNLNKQKQIIKRITKCSCSVSLSDIKGQDSSDLKCLFWFDIYTMLVDV